MARQLRIEFPGAWHHIVARGNERSDADRRRLLELLGETGERFRLRVHGYVFMPNHYHLIVETPEVGLSRAMQWLNGSYTVWFNRRHGRSGHLFQGRYKAVLVDPAEWGVELSRYVELLPSLCRTGKAAVVADGGRTAGSDWGSEGQDARGLSSVCRRGDPGG